MGALAGWAVLQRSQIINERTALETISIVPAGALATGAAAATSDLSQSLPPLPTAARLASIVDVATRDAEASLLRINLTEHAATPSQFARMDAEFALKGPYPAIKRVLIEVLARLPTATVRRLNMQGNDGLPDAQGGASLQATVSLVVWGPPMAAGTR